MKIYIVRKCGGEYSDYWDSPVVAFTTEEQAKCYIMQLQSEYKKAYEYMHNSKDTAIEKWRDAEYWDYLMPEEAKRWYDINVPYLTELCGYPTFGYFDYDHFKLESTNLYNK